MPRRLFRLLDRKIATSTDIFEQIIAYAAGAPINVINPDVLKGGAR